MVRMYAGSLDVGRVDLIQPMRGYLTAKLDGVDLKPAQLTCSSLPRIGYSTGTTSYLRENLNRSLNCVLPSAWISSTGRLELVGHVYAPGVDESSPSNNRRSVTINLEPTVPVMLRSVQVRDCGDPNDCDETKGPVFSDYSSIHKLAEHMYPMGQIVLEPPGSRWMRADGTDGTSDALLARFGALRNERNGFVDVVFGASRKLHPWIGGMGWNQRFWSRVDTPKAPSLMTHEFGHTLALIHVDACGAVGPGFSTYPGAPKLDVVGHRSAFGLDFGQSPPAVKAPGDHHDIMSYCYDWISRKHYLELHDTLKQLSSGGIFLADGGSGQPEPEAANQELDPEARFLGVFGAIDLATEAVTLIDPERMRGSEIAPAAFGPDAGDHLLRAVDASGGMLAEQRFEIEGDSEEGARASFNVLLPDLPETAALILLREGRVLHRANWSASEPSLALDPLPRLSGTAISPSWTADDADGDALRASFYLSLDDGKTWRLELAGQPSERGKPSSLRLDTRQWPASDAARLRLRVSDGLREAEAISPAFIIPGKSPEAWISAPVDGGVLAPDSPLLLSGEVDHGVSPSCPHRVIYPDRLPGTGM